jgi:hypothetical protein
MEAPELVRIAMFTLEQSARRLQMLASEVEGDETGTRLRGIADALTERARSLQRRQSA